MLAIFSYDGFVDDTAKAGEQAVGVVLDRTGFYAEAGGQVADTGALVLSEGGATLDVLDVQNFAG